MATELDVALNNARNLISDTSKLVRVVLSGRRRNMSVPFERIDIRPVSIKGGLSLQISQNDGRVTTTKNLEAKDFDAKAYLEMGYANILVEHIGGALTIRITKKGEAQVHEEKGLREQNLEHDRKKSRLLDASDPFLIEVGISDSEGRVKPTKADKYLQVEEFLRLLVPTLNSAIEAKHIAKPTTEKPLVIADLGCGSAYLTFAVHQYFQERGFVYVNTPIITGSDAEGAGEMFRVTALPFDGTPRNDEGKVNFKEDFFGKETNLTVSGQLEAETFAMLDC